LGRFVYLLTEVIVTFWVEQKNYGGKIMIKSRRKAIAFQMFLLSVLILVAATVCFGKILFFEDFEVGEIDTDIWIPANSWKIVDGVLDANGGGEMPGITVKDDFTDFEFSCDFKMVSKLYSAEPVLRATGNQPQDSFYLFQIVADNRHQFWPTTRNGGGWQIDKIADESGVNPQLNEWYSMKIIAKGGGFDCYYNQRGEEELKFAFHWENDIIESGAIGFRELGGEHCMYDNVLVTTIGHTAISPRDSLPTTWGAIKCALD